MPTSVRFRDAEQVRRALGRYAEAGDLVAPAAAGGFDVWLGNGFRAVAVLPPEVMDQPPMAVFVRGVRPPRHASAVQPIPVPQPVAEAAGTVRIPPPAERPEPPDLYAPVRQQVTRRIITQFAAAGVHDLNRLPLPELRKIVLA